MYIWKKREKETNILQKFESTTERTWILLYEIKSLSKCFLLKNNSRTKKSKGVIDWLQTLGRNPQA